MNIIKIVKLRIKNKRQLNNKIQSKRIKCCESCKYCYFVDSIIGHDIYTCILREKEFNGDAYEGKIYEYKCNNYKPCRKYRKYLENK